MIEENVLYEELLPSEFLERLKICPVAYLPLGTLEWHGPHLPLGTDGLESKYLFERAALEIGGIVLPMIFLGVDRYYKDHVQELYGMDMYLSGVNIPKEYSMQQLTGSAYWVPDETFDLIIDSIIKQLGRAGFKIVVGYGHGPSTTEFERLDDIFEQKYDVRLITPNTDLTADEKKKGLILDHAGESETSAIMYFRSDLVHMERLPSDIESFPPGMGGRDPRLYSAPENASQRVEYLIDHMKQLINRILEK